MATFRGAYFAGAGATASSATIAEDDPQAQLRAAVTRGLHAVGEAHRLAANLTDGEVNGASVEVLRQMAGQARRLDSALMQLLSVPSAAQQADSEGVAMAMDAQVEIAGLPRHLAAVQMQVDRNVRKIIDRCQEMGGQFGQAAEQLSAAPDGQLVEGVFVAERFARAAAQFHGLGVGDEIAEISAMVRMTAEEISGARSRAMRVIADAEAALRRLQEQ